MNTQGLTAGLYSLLSQRKPVTFEDGACDIDYTSEFATLNAGGVACCLCSISENSNAVLTASLFSNQSKTLSMWAKRVSDGTAFNGTVNVNILLFITYN